MSPPTLGARLGHSGLRPELYESPYRARSEAVSMPVSGLNLDAILGSARHDGLTGSWRSQCRRARLGVGSRRRIYDVALIGLVAKPFTALQIRPHWIVKMSELVKIL